MPDLEYHTALVRLSQRMGHQTMPTHHPIYCRPEVLLGDIDQALFQSGFLQLSIARDIIEATQGQLALGTSALGGLQVRLQWAALAPTA